MKANRFLSFGRVILIAILFLFCQGLSIDGNAQRFTRDLNVNLLVNHVGYVPNSGKNVVTKGYTTRKFEVINIETKKIIYAGNFSPYSGDFGEYSVGDFSSVNQEGHYYIKSDTLRSYPFTISKTIYKSPMDLIVGYFSLQRCGASTTGYLSPCHLDDGVRMDNGKYQDVSGGWHDASDLRKWVSATIYGMLGLGKTYELRGILNPERYKMLEELKWGNQYFLKMQEPEGYVMNYVGGDVKKHADSNRWTDNEIGEEEGELRTVMPTTGKAMREMLIFGSKDDRVIRTDPADLLAQYNFITTQAMMTRITINIDPEYSQKCLQAAIKCFNWCNENEKKLNAGTIGSSIQAATEMYKTTKENIYKNFAVAKASELRKLQVIDQDSSIGGFFHTSSFNKEPHKNISRGCFEFISVCDLIETFPTHNDVPLWTEMITIYANNYLSLISQKNSFGIIPFGLYTGKNPGGNRKIGEYWYRYFMQPELSWWVGINANIASAGIGLLKAAKILNDTKLKVIAQKQLDWIIGVNPYNSSTIISVGYNQPSPMRGGGEFNPFTPTLPGAVMNGLGGDSSDQPVIGTGNWQVAEYWTPMVAFTLWLMAEIQYYE
ncbi:MAG: glycoside hydrolase family 9 protein [Bacteroidota bacterium]